MDGGGSMGGNGEGGSMEELGGGGGGGGSMPGISARQILNEVLIDVVQGTEMQQTMMGRDGNGDDASDVYSNMLSGMLFFLFFEKLLFVFFHY